MDLLTKKNLAAILNVSSFLSMIITVIQRNKMKTAMKKVDDDCEEYAGQTKTV